MKWFLLFFCLIFVSCIPAQTPEGAIQTRLKGRSGLVIKDDRDQQGQFGIRIGGVGIIRSANVTIKSVIVESKGDIATVETTYEGIYTKKGSTYQKTIDITNKIYGSISFTLKQVDDENVVLKWDTIDPATTIDKDTIDKDINHDSNQLAVEAAKSALYSAFVLR
jgi:hypothetical protein